MSLSAAIIAVMGAIHAVEKNGLNTHFKFKYQAWDDVLPAVKLACVEHNLAVIPEVKEVIRENKQVTSIQNNKEVIKDASKVTVLMNYHLLSGDDSMVVSYAGEALDNDDKAIQKAITSATKYFYLKTFMIPIEGEEDPDGASAKTQPNTVSVDDARRVLIQKSKDHWKRLGGSVTQWEQLVKSLQDVEGPKCVDFVQTCVSEGVADLQGIYDYASSFFKIDVPFVIGGSAS